MSALHTVASSGPYILPADRSSLIAELSLVCQRQSTVVCSPQVWLTSLSGVSEPPVVQVRCESLDHMQHHPVGVCGELHRSRDVTFSYTSSVCFVLPPGSYVLSLIANCVSNTRMEDTASDIMSVVVTEQQHAKLRVVRHSLK